MVAIERESKITNVPPTFAQRPVKDGLVWLETKRIDDRVEDGLWRIHNAIYDLTDFVNKHPGGADWIEMTKGHDITELVETHHVFPDRLKIYLDKYRVRETSAPRNSKLCFKPDGFYVTLRNRVAGKIAEYQRQNYGWLTKFYVDALFFVTLVLAILALRTENYFVAFVCGVLYTWTGISGHNFFHQKDNYRMYYFNLLFMSYRDWRISHAISHHMFPNSLLDYELIQYEPIFHWIPTADKTFVQRYVSWIYAPFLYVGTYYVEVVKKFIKVFTEKNYFRIDDAVILVVPTIMFLFSGNASFLTTLKWYAVILTVSSFWFGFVGLNAGHHHPDILHEGDAVRDCYDFGLYTIDTIIDRQEIRGKTIFTLTHFGDHVLHHLFPTVDHAILPHLYEDLFAMLKDFESEARAYPFWQLITGQFQQLARTEPSKECSKTKFREKTVKSD